MLFHQSAFAQERRCWQSCTMSHNKMDENDRKTNLLRFLATRWYILQALSLLALTVLGHFTVVSPKLNMLIHLFILTPYDILKKYQYDDTPKNKKTELINKVVKISLLVIVVIGLIAEFIWPNNKWVLIIRLITVVAIIGWSLYIKDKV